MSSAQHTNQQFNLVTKKIRHLVHRSNKLRGVGLSLELHQEDRSGGLKVRRTGGPKATAFAQHGNAATALALLLLSCAAEIWDKSGPNGKMKALPNWNAVSDGNPHICGHPLFTKTLEVAAILVPTPSPAMPPPANVVWSHNLFVPGNANANGNKCKASSAEPVTNQVKPPAPSKEFISDNEDVQVPNDQVISVKSKVNTEPSTQPAIPQIAKLDATESLDSSTKDATISEVWHSVCLFGMQCERCINDDVPCTVILGKKQGEVHECCCNCDEKKTKCIRSTSEQEQQLWAMVTSKKAKVMAAADEKAWCNNHTSAGHV
ncbi:hypothetical protein F4604DRAFT_1933755 [Suillus subluteus]|nr:hypothetical protein F4604DRAFT_1933755 [Suillus subluteus]